MSKASPPRFSATDATACVDHAKASCRHWLAIARRTRLEMPEERYGLSISLATAAGWRQRAVAAEWDRIDAEAKENTQ